MILETISAAIGGQSFLTGGGGGGGGMLGGKSSSSSATSSGEFSSGSFSGSNTKTDWSKIVLILAGAFVLASYIRGK